MPLGFDVLIEGCRLIADEPQAAESGHPLFMVAKFPYRVPVFIMVRQKVGVLALRQTEI